MSQVKNKLQWCLNKAKRETEEGKKHRGLLKVDPDPQKASEHLTKAEHNLQVTLYLKNGGYTDWCSSSLFYVIYQCFLAILAREGYETRNQECTFAVIADLVEDKKISLTKDDLSAISSLDTSNVQETSYTAVSIREEYQYGSKVSLENKEYEKLLALAMKIMERTKEYLL